MKHLTYYVPGSLLILMAVLIIAVPEILITLVSLLILMMGFFILHIGHSMRKSEIELIRTDDRFRTVGRYMCCFFK